MKPGHTAHQRISILLSKQDTLRASLCWYKTNKCLKTYFVANTTVVVKATTKFLDIRTIIPVD